MAGALPQKKKGALAYAEWDTRLLDAEAEALRYRMSSMRLRLSNRSVAQLQDCVMAALNSEVEALAALEAEAVRQQQQQQHALKYGQYLSVLSAHIEAASGGSIGMIKLAPDSEEVRQILGEVGVPLGSPLQILHAYRLRNAKLQDDFNRKTSSLVSSSASGGGGGGSGSSGHPNPPAGYVHRLLALRLPASAVEHALVHGLRPKPSVAHALDWQVDPQTVPEAGCVDMKSLSSIVRASAPPHPPFALFAGAAAWEELLAGAVEEAIIARDAACRELASARGNGNKGIAGAAVASSLPQNKLILLSRVLMPMLPTDGIAERLATHSPPGRTGQSNHAHHHPRAPPPPGTATTSDPEMVQPLYLLHYGTMTAPPPEPQMPPAPLSQTSGSEKNVAQYEARTVSEPRAVRNDSKASSKAQGGGGGGPKAVNRPVAVGREDPDSAVVDQDQSRLPPALRATREYSQYLACRQASAERLREVAGVFSTTIEGIRAQLTPARAATLVEEARREAELQVLLADAKAELSKLKKTNRDLASELTTTYA